MSEPLFTGIDQVAVVVEDAFATAQYLCDHFGIGPWFHLQFGDAGDGNANWAAIDDCVTEGDPIGTYSIHCICCSMPNGVEIEVISPIRGSSIFDRYLKRHGPGVQHVSIVLPDFDAAITRMKDAGFANGQLATVDKTETCAFIDHLSAIGTYLELHKRPEVFVLPAIEMSYIPGPTADDLPARPKAFAQLECINIATADLEASLAVMRDHYGFTDWTVTENEKARTAYYGALNIGIRISQPKDPDSADAEAIAAHGTDITSLSVSLDGEISDIPLTAHDGGSFIDLKQIFGTELKVEP